MKARKLPCANEPRHDLFDVDVRRVMPKVDEAERLWPQRLMLRLLLA